jgi:hypothetical protein
MLSDLSFLLATAKKNNLFDIVAIIQNWQGQMKFVFDTSFVNGAQYKSITRVLNDLGTANLVLEIELSELFKLVSEMDDNDLPIRLEWIRQDIQRISACLKSLQEKLVLIRPLAKVAG